MSARYEMRMRPPLATLVLSGEFDLSEWDELGRRLRSIEMAMVDVVEIHVDDVEFIDVACLRMLAQMRRRLAGRGRRLVLVGVTPRLHRIARLAGFPDLVA